MGVEYTVELYIAWADMLCQQVTGGLVENSTEDGQILMILSTLIKYVRRPFAVRYRGADKSLTRPGRKQSQKHVKDPRDFNNIETRAVIKFFSLQGKAPKEIHAILTETLACFLHGPAKDLSVPLYLTMLAI